MNFELRIPHLTLQHQHLGHATMYTSFLSCGEKSNFKEKNLLELIKRRSKVHEENLSRDCALKLDQ